MHVISVVHENLSQFLMDDMVRLLLKQLPHLIVASSTKASLFSPVDEFAFVEPVNSLHQSVIIEISNHSDRSDEFCVS